MNISIVFENGIVELKSGTKTYKGSLLQIYSKLEGLYKKFISDNCEKQVKHFLEIWFSNFVKDIPIKNRGLRDIQYDLWEFIETSEVKEMLENEMPCIHVTENESVCDGHSRFTAVLTNKKALFDITLKATNTGILVNVKEAMIVFED